MSYYDTAYGPSFGIILLLLIIALYVLDQKGWAGALLVVLLIAILI
ncbi:MAG: hypothetical protein AAGA21_13605 [Pseudomonadota bacterium]